MVSWILSDQTIPRSYRMVQGFSVNTFVLVNKEGKRTFVKFHWKPHLGKHSLCWDEALKLGGQDPDYLRRDLQMFIDAGIYPKYELGVQLVPEEDEDKFSFDLLDCTKVIPEEEVPIKWVGTMTLNKTVTDQFAENEQVAFCTQNIVPGIDYSDDPMLHVSGYLEKRINLTTHRDVTSHTLIHRFHVWVASTSHSFQSINRSHKHAHS